MRLLFDFTNRAQRPIREVEVMQISQRAIYLLSRLNQAGYRAYVVGGCVRDLLMGNTPGDWDITTSATPQQVLALFSDLCTAPTGLAHGTVTVLVEHEPFEVTTFRKDGVYTDHRRPKSVSFVSDLTEDLARRDFTMNAIAYHPEVGLVDPFGGKADIERRIVRAVGDAERRFFEDALRILRALRFASTLGFTIEEETDRAARACAPTLRSIARERITTEFLKLLCGRNAERVLQGAADVLRILFAKPLCTSGLSALCADRITRLCFVFQNAPENLQDLRLDRNTAARVRRILNYRGHDARCMVRDLGEDAARCLDLRAGLGEPVDALRQELSRIQREKLCCTLAQLAVSGHDLIAAGIPAGKQIGQILHRLLDEVIQENIPNERERLLQCAFDIARTL